MTWAAPTTKTTGAVITAAVWNQDVVANTTHLGNVHNHKDNVGAGGGGALPFIALDIPCVGLRNSTSQNIGSGAVAATFNTEEFDTDTMHDTSSNTSRITCKTAGIYWVYANAIWNTTNNTGYRRLWLRRNGSGNWAESPSVADGFNATTSHVHGYFVAAAVALAVNDYVEMVVEQTGANPLVLTTNVSSPHTVFGAYWLAPAP